MSPSVAAPSISPDPRYPIGRWQRPTAGDVSMRADALNVLGELPQDLRAAVRNLDDEQLGTPYREGGWTVRQVVHHLADSHMNLSIRIRLALTEDAPTIKPYDESAWAALHDGEDAPMEWSLQIVEALHARLAMLLRSLTEAQWQRTYVHPENGAMTLDEVASLYAWHGRHHVAQITALQLAQGW